MRPRVAARLEGLSQSDRLRGGVAEASSRSLSRSLTLIRWGGRWPLCRRASRGPTGAPRRPIGGHHPACSTCFGLNFSVLLVAARCGINPWGRDTHSARHPRSVPVTPPSLQDWRPCRAIAAAAAPKSAHAVLLPFKWMPTTTQLWAFTLGALQ